MRKILLMIALSVVSASLPADTQRLLVPIVIDGEVNGALGSKWVSSITAYNDSDESISYRASSEPCSITCPPDPSLAPGEVAMVEILPNQSGGGMYLVYDPPSSGRLVINARIQDISRAAMTWGTELPVIPGDRFRDRVTLVAIPTDSEFRSSLRVYGHVADEVRVRVRDQASGVIVAEETMGLSAYGSDPLQAFVGDLAAGLGVPQGITVVVTLEPKNPANRIWAFSSVTNNETQHVTLITPQP